MSTIDKASLIQIPSGYKNGKLYSVKPTPTYGSELVTNGGFDTDSDWTKGTGWTISGGKANCDGSQTGNTLLYQNVGHSANKTYLLTFTISNYSSGQIDFALDSPFGGTTSGNGDYQVTLQPTSGGNFIIRANSTFIGSIDNVSVKEATNIGDFDFSRSSSATRVNSEGLIETAQVVSTTELVTNGDFASDSDWTKGSGWSIANGVATSDGVSSNSNFSQNNILTLNKFYKVSVDVVLNSGTLQVYISSLPTKVITSSGSYIFYGLCDRTDLDLHFKSVNFDGSIDNVSVKEVIENDVPRLDYSDGSCASLLLEGQSTNLITYSESLSNTNRSGTFVDNSAISPDGTQNATKITATSTDPFFYQSVTLNAATYTASLWVKGIGDSIGKKFRFAISNQTHISNKYTIPSEWTRFEFTASVSAGSVTTGVEIIDPAVVGDEVLAWGWQLEESSFATSYIPSNSGSTTTRSADVCNNAGTSATFNDSEGVLFAEIAALADDLTTRIISLSDGTNTNRIHLFYYSQSNDIAVNYRVSGSTVVSFVASLTDITNYSKVAFKWKSGDFKMYVDGNLIDSDTNTTMLPADTIDTLSFSRGDGFENFYGKTKQLMVFDEALSDEELSDLTGQVNLSFNNLATFYGYTIL